MLTQDAIDLFSRSVLCWLASADGDGRPSVSPKEIFTVTATDEILIADIASPRSVRNIVGRAQVCVAAVDVFDQRGYQVYGRAEVIPADSPGFEALSTPLTEIAGPRFPVRSVIRVRVEHVARILAPSLWMYPDVDPARRRAGVLHAYGVREG